MGGGGQNSKCQGCSVPVKTQSAKICLNLNFRGGGEFCTSQNSKCQDVPKFQFFWGGGGARGVLYQIPEQGVLANLSTNFALPLSGSLRIWRLNKYHH